MDIIILIALLALFLLTGAFAGWFALFKYKNLNERITCLEKTLNTLKNDARQKTTHPETAKNEQQDLTVEPLIHEEDKQQPAFTASEETGIVQKTIKKVLRNNTAPEESEQATPLQNTNQSAPKETFKWLQSLVDNWMIWLGGICVGLAGIFLVRYSIEAGLLGPAQRTLAAYATGIGLHVLAQWLRNKTGGWHPAFAALAGGASITLYAATLAALHLYQLVSPIIAFSVLAIISLFTMLLALRDGPILAIIGILGAYLVPMLVGGNSGTIVGVMVYALIISSAALLLMRYVYTSWLWYSVLVGSLGWWAISFDTVLANGFRGYYLALFAYILLAVPSFDWLLNKKDKECNPEHAEGASPFTHPLFIGLGCCIAAQTISITLESFTANAFLVWSPLYLLILLSTRERKITENLPWIAFALGWLAWLYCGISFNQTSIRLVGIIPELQRDFLLFSAAMAAMYSGVSWWIGREKTFSHIRCSLMVLAPVFWFALAYLMVTDLSVSWQWSLAAAVLAVVYLVMAGIREKQDQRSSEAMWLVLAGHFSFSLAAYMFLREASLTLVLALQIISLVYTMKTYSMPALSWVVKGVLALIVTRLTLNPWLLNYPPDVHWSLWTYGGTVLCCVVASRLLSEKEALKKWLEAASLHLLVLFLAAETRYWLYDGNIFVPEYTLTEAAINTALWSGGGLAYYYRSKVSDLLAGYYKICAAILAGLALINYVIVVIFLNPLWNKGVIGSTPVFNLLLLAYGAPVIMGILYLIFYDKTKRQLSSIFTGIALFVFVNLEIRHLFNDRMLISLPTSDGELYTYSIVWLIMAILTILAALHFGLAQIKKVGMGLLMAVIAKIFLVDMSDLEGLLRVASFMGLGLSLLGLAYLYQKITPEKKEKR